MNLKTRLLLGYGYLVTLVVLGAITAALGFSRLGDDLGQVLADNFESVRAATDMIEALERQDSALLALLLGQEEGAEAALSPSETAFRQALEAARANLTEESEEQVIEQIAQRFEAFRAARQELLARRPERPLRAYEEETFPRFEAVKASVLELLELNHEAMVAADRAAEAAAGRGAVFHGLLAAVGLLSLGLLSRGLNRRLLGRLDEVEEVAEAIARGDRSRRADDRESDELGLVARQLNAVLDTQAELEGTMRGRLAQQRQLVLGVLAERTGPAALFTLTGDLVATFLDSEETTAARRALADLAEAEREAGSAEIATAGRTLRLTRLKANGVRPVGWLATFASDR